MMPSVRIYTLGCKVNQYDTQAIRETFTRLGYRSAQAKETAAVCVVNTCTVTHRTDADSLNIIRRAVRENPGAGIIVTGCLAARDAEKIRAACPAALIVDNADKDRFEDILRDSYSVHPAEQVRDHRAKEGISRFEGRTRAFLKIQDGCDNYCSYCKIPYVRGRSRSRQPDEVIAEARRLVSSGFKEIVLCGICLGAYGRDLEKKVTLARLLISLAEVEGLRRIRLSSIEATDIDAALIKTIAAVPQVCRHLHIPIQSGDDGILAAMNRRYRRVDYLALIRKLRRGIPDLAVTTDVLVGFPGETDRAFKNTLTLVGKLQPLKVHAFPYSRRAGTAAADLASTAVDPRMVRSRIRELNVLAAECGRAYMTRRIGTRTQVLIEERVKDSPGLWHGRTGNYIEVRLHSRKLLANQLVSVLLTGLSSDGMLGRSSP